MRTVLALLLSGVCLLGMSCKDDKGTGPDPGPTPITTWAVAIGGTGADVAEDVIVTSDNGFLVVGSTSSLGSGRQMVAVKLDSLGTVEWVYDYGDAHYQDGLGVVRTSDGGYVIAGMTSTHPQLYPDVYIVKIDSAGVMEWETEFTGAYAESTSDIVQKSDGNYVASGFTSSCDDCGPCAAMLVNVNSSGTVVGQELYGGGNFDDFTALALAGNGDLVMTGTSSSAGLGHNEVYVVRTESDGDTLWCKWYGGSGNEWGYDVVAASDGDFYVVGATGSSGVDNYEGWVLKVDGTDGDTLWTSIIPNDGYDYCYGVCESHTGGCIAVGQFADGSGRIVASVYSITDGVIDWSVPHGAGNESAKAVQRVADGGYVVAGFTYNYGNGDYDMYVLKTNEIGEVESDSVVTQSLQLPLM